MKSLLLALTLVAASATFATPTKAQPDRNVSVYNLDQSLGLKGYDPVSYFSEGGGSGLEGNQSISYTYGGVTYFFVSEANRDLFKQTPTKYEPTYGGWCAWAMANKAYADINPKLYTLLGNRLHFFISRGAKFRFDRAIKNGENIEKRADDFWRSESGEEPRR